MIVLAPFSCGRHGASQAPHHILAYRNGESKYHPLIAEAPIHHHDALATSKNIEKVLADQSNYLVLGGDHSITDGIIRARAKDGKVHIVLFDAHTDDYHDEKIVSAKPLHSGNWLKRIIDDGLVSGVTMFDGNRGGVPKKYQKKIPTTGRVHVTVDIDVLAVSEIGSATDYPELGGYKIEELINKIDSLNLSGADVTADYTEYDPTKDVTGVGAWCSSKIVDSLLSIITP